MILHMYMLPLAETRSAVVEVGHPWSNVTIKRKLPPLKYYYDFEMSKYSIARADDCGFVLQWFMTKIDGP